MRSYIYALNSCESGSRCGYKSYFSALKAFVLKVLWLNAVKKLAEAKQKTAESIRFAEMAKKIGNML